MVLIHLMFRIFVTLLPVMPELLWNINICFLLLSINHRGFFFYNTQHDVSIQEPSAFFPNIAVTHAYFFSVEEQNLEQRGTRTKLNCSTQHLSEQEVSYLHQMHTHEIIPKEEIKDTTRSFNSLRDIAERWQLYRPSLRPQDRASTASNHQERAR